MVTLERIVESIKLQLKPHLTEDVIVLDEWLIEMINQSRSALIRKIYVSGESFTPFYQDIVCTSMESDSVGGVNIGLSKEYAFQKVLFPEGVELVGGCGKKNIQYLGLLDYSLVDIQYVELEEFMAYSYHRFGATLPSYTSMVDHLLVRNTNRTGVSQPWLLRAIILHPQYAPGYDYRETIYPIDGANLRQLEIITFQHIAQKLGLPVDIINNGSDETKNAPAAQQGQRRQQEQPQEEE